jgi:phosphate uptake regulator
MRDHYDDVSDEELMQFVKDAIVKRERLTFHQNMGSMHQRSCVPYDSNDLGDKVYQHGGDLLSAYIMQDDAELLRIIKMLCQQEIDSIYDLAYG